MDIEKALDQLDNATFRATAIALANKVVLALSMAGLPVTLETAERALRLMLDPSSRATGPLVKAVLPEVAQMMQVAEKLSPPGVGNA